MQVTEEECLKIAEDYLSSLAVEYLRPGHTGFRDSCRWEAIFRIPEVMDPAVAAVDPPDVRVWVSLVDRKVQWIHQM
ncbi:hypothetical protein [Pseudoduganella lutea]|uniref:Uncharacterized protein n=1 Tax=Pseudoduganella lutea TaxID=321985 RepID=A0A4V0Z4H0_9BURK|nr:hypothetical protein [Pseudoduganella lutea]QBE66913.1 hypothetical protein EWM63_31330 [Pseudoduganella lutea]